MVGYLQVWCVERKELLVGRSISVVIMIKLIISISDVDEMVNPAW
jgi:hypothetical protein